jgi:NADPH2:quinone reductase
MKAVICKEWGPIENLTVEEIDNPIAGEGQVVVTVKACGVNFPDVLIVQGKYQFKPAHPFSPGGEISGVVKQVGAGVDNFKVGDEVFASVGWGGFAEEVAVDAARLNPIPAGANFPVASAFVMTYGTSHHALKQCAKLQPGETLLVLGAAGGVGLAAVELGKLMGAKVIAAASSDEKLEICEEYGADEVINYTTEDLKTRVKELTGGKGVDVCYDPVGDKYSEPAVRSMGWKGRFLVVGFAGGEIAKIPLNLALLKGCSIVGVFWGRFIGEEPEVNKENMAELMGWLKDRTIKPLISGEYKLEEAVKALQDMSARKVKGKIVLVP